MTTSIIFRHFIQFFVAEFLVAVLDCHNLTRNVCLSGYYALNIVEEPYCCFVIYVFQRKKKEIESEAPLGVIESHLKATVKLTLCISIITCWSV